MECQRVCVGENTSGEYSAPSQRPDAKSWLIGKYPDAGMGWGQEEKGMTEDEMAGWHHRLASSLSTSEGSLKQLPAQHV